MYVESEELVEEVKELKTRIRELEQQLALLLRPVEDMRNNTIKYLKLVEIAVKNGGITPDGLLPEIKDPICKDIICVLVDGRDQNITQIASGVKSRRGSASRKTVREKIALLLEGGYVKKNSDKKIPTYNISNEVLRKWSQMLGIHI